MMILVIVFAIIQCSITTYPQNETLIELEYQSLVNFDYLKNCTTKVSSYFKFIKNIFKKLFIIRGQYVFQEVLY